MLLTILPETDASQRRSDAAVKTLGLYTYIHTMNHHRHRDKPIIFFF